MLRITRSLALPLVALLLLLAEASRAEAQVVYVPVYRPPTVVTPYYPPVARVSYYYPAPAVSYYPAPAVSYYAPAPSVYYPPPVAATTRYGLFGRREYTRYYYSAPVYVYP